MPNVAKIEVEIRGGAPHGSPLLMHRYPGEKPSRPKPPRGQKTQAWLDEQRKEMWFDALYHDGVGLYIPSDNLERMLVDGGRRFRKGQLFVEAVFVQDAVNRLVLYESDSLNAAGKEAIGGLHMPEGLVEEWDCPWWLPQYRDLRGVVNSAGKTKIRLDCMRPIFRQWGVRFTVVHDPKLVPASQVQKALERNSIGAYRPRFGRFLVTEFTPEGGNGDTSTAG